MAPLDAPEESISAPSSDSTHSEHASSSVAVTPPLPRLILYAQTHFHEDRYISLLPLLTSRTSLTHLIVAAIHLNAEPSATTLNDDPWASPKLRPLYNEIKILQAAGVKVMGMLGGAAKGSFARLDGKGDGWKRYYEELKKVITRMGFQGLDLDVEEHMSLWGVVRLILQLKEDCGKDFIITLAPVATALEGRPDEPVWLPEGLRWRRFNISGFNYLELEDVVGELISWYNAQFYCGWGDLRTTEGYERIMAKGWKSEKVVIGASTSERNAAGAVEVEELSTTLARCMGMVRRRNGGGEQDQLFGGVMGWEYWNSDGKRNEDWAKRMSEVLRLDWHESEVAKSRAETAESLQAEGDGKERLPEELK